MTITLDIPDDIHKAFMGALASNKPEEALKCEIVAFVRQRVTEAAIAQAQATAVAMASAGVDALPFDKITVDVK